MSPVKKKLTKNIFFAVGINLLVALLFIGLDHTPYRIVSSPGIFSTVVTLVAFHFGLVAGVLGSIIPVVYTAFHFSLPGHLFSFYPADLSRVVMWIFVFPLQGFMIGLLKDQLIKKIESEKMLQQILVSTSKFVATGEMAASIAHEINTPLTAIVLNAEMISILNNSLPQPSAEIAKRALVINDVGHRISKIIDGLRGFSRDASEDKHQTFQIKDLIAITLDLCNEKFKNHGVQLVIMPEFLEVSVNGKMIQLSQTLLNLLNNSFDAIENLDNKWVRITAKVKHQNLELCVTDSGSGIPKEIAEKIFQPFFTMKDVGKGTGLGLSISNRIVREHGGTLTYDSESENTRFVIRLPAIG